MLALAIAALLAAGDSSITPEGVKATILHDFAGPGIYLEGDPHAVCGTKVKCIAGQRSAVRDLQEARDNLMHDWALATKADSQGGLREVEMQAGRWSICVAKNVKFGTGTAFANNAWLCWLIEMIKPLPDHPDEIPSMLGSSHDSLPEQ